MLYTVQVVKRCELLRERALYNCMIITIITGKNSTPLVGYERGYLADP